MLDFESYYKNKQTETLVAEGSISSIVSFVKNAFKSAISKLGFGQRTRIKVDTSSLVEYLESRMLTLSEDKSNSFGAGLRRYNGVFTEAVVAKEVVKLLNRDGGLDPDTDLKEIEDEYKNNLKAMNDLGKEHGKESQVKAAVDLAKKNGKVLAETMINDIKNDSSIGPIYQEFILVKPVMTGKKLAGVTKADLWLEIYHVGKQKALEKVEASIKSYKSGSSIQVLGTTYQGILNGLFFGGEKKSGNWDNFISDFMKIYGKANAKDLAELYRAQNPYARIENLKADRKKLPKAEMNQASKEWDRKGALAMKRIFDRCYKGKNKIAVNQNILKLFGFDGSDTIYAILNDQVLSGKSNKEFRKFLEDFQKDFTASITVGAGATGAGKFLFKTPKGAELLSSGIAQSRAAGSVSYQINANMKRFLQKH